MSDDQAGGEDISTADTMRERTNESRIKLWILLRARRLVVSGALCVVIFIAVVLFGLFHNPPFRSTIAGSDTIETTFSTLIGGVITTVTFVVSISQLVISQENGPLGDQRQRMSDAMDFRTYTEELTGSVTPADPSHFLRTYVDASEEQAKRVRDLVSDNDNEELRSEIDTLVDSLMGNGKEVREELEGATFGSFKVVFAALNYNYSSKIYHIERLKLQYGDSIDKELKIAMDDLRTAISMFGPAREHVKTLYFQWGLIDLSQMILYVTVPALVVAGCMLAFVGSNSFPGATFGIDDLLLVYAFAFAVTLFPLTLFISYILRIATVAKRTLAIGPLILRDSQR